ncbi:MAG: RNA methyltransferase [Phyllobacteriaceae bacterium]|nr:RNA methyltransferase [Phyllobacteriaceae bacterium]
MSDVEATATPEGLRPPAIVLVETQMGENIGAAARAMANFGLRDLRLIKPRDGWPNDKARAAASRGDAIIDEVRLFDTVEDAIADLELVFATTARAHDLAKEVESPAVAAQSLMVAARAGVASGILFGREKWGLTSDEVGLADRIVTIPVDPVFASLNIAQAVIILAYEWRRQVVGDPAWTPFVEKERSPQASKADLLALFDHLEGSLDAVEFFRPLSKRPVMVRNLRQIFQKARLSEQEVRTLRGVIAALERRPTRLDQARAELERKESLSDKGN